MRRIERRPRGVLPGRPSWRTAAGVLAADVRIPTRLAPVVTPVLTTVFTAIFALLLGSALAPTASAEVCTGEPRALEILDPGDGDDSGVGGTGLERAAQAAFDRAHARLGASEQNGESDESGIGGTGRSPRDPRPQQDDESGLGGTGIHGPVTQTDRLCVNGVAIAVPAALPLEGSAGVAAAQALSVGQIVFVDARRTEEGLVARRILLAEAYVGRIEAVDASGRSLVVSGQRIRVPQDVPRGPGLGAKPLEPGTWLAVHGLPNARGEIVATRVEAAPADGPSRKPTKTRVDLAGWLGSVPDLDYVSLEGFVTGPATEPRVSGLALGFTAAESITSERARVRPGARVRVGGWLEGRETLRIALPPRPGSTMSPRPGQQPPSPRPESDTRPRSESAPGPRPTRRPEDAAPRKPILRPDIVRPTSVRPSIDRPTRRDILPRR